MDNLVWGRWQDATEDEIEKASTRAVEYASQFENPVIVLEYLDGITDEDIGTYWNRRLGRWLFSRLQSRIEDKTAEHGIPVKYVHPHHTSKTCNTCQHVGYRPHQATFKCTNDSCWVSEYQADLNAAANIADRLHPWGESLPWKPAGGDSPQSGGQWQAHKDTSQSEELPSERRASDDKDSLAHQRWERGRNRRPGTRTRLEILIQRLAGIPPMVEAPPFRAGEDVTMPRATGETDEE